MIKGQILPLFVLVSFIVGALNTLAIKFSLYWALPWFDTIVHFFSGAWVALIVVILFFNKEKVLIGVSPSRLSYVIIVVMIIGILWEIFEVWTGNTQVTKETYVFDTATDLLGDLFGGIAVYFLVRQKR